MGRCGDVFFEIFSRASFLLELVERWNLRSSKQTYKDQVTYNTTLVAMRKAGLSRQALRASESLVKPDAADPYTYCTWV